MKLRTLALVLALSCGLGAIGEAKTKTVRPYKASKTRKFKAGKFKSHKQVVKRHVVKH